MALRQSQSWLSTASRKAKEGFFQAMGGHVVSEDREFDERHKSFLNHINELQKMEQLMELWIESFDAFCLSTTILCDAWASFHSSSPFQGSDNSSPSPYSYVTSELNKASSTVQRQLQPLIHETFTNRCLKPVNNILALVPELSEQIQQRKSHLADFDSYKVKLQKEHAAGRDNSHPNVQKKALKLDESAKKLQDLQTSIYKTFDEFEHARSQTLGPEFATFLACCHTFSATIHNSTSKLLPYIPQVVSTLAALDYSAIASELKLDRADPTLVKNIQEKKVCVASTVYDRPELAGGKHGGYGIAAVPTSLNDSERENGKPEAAEKIDDKSPSRVTSIRFKEPIVNETEANPSSRISSDLSTLTHSGRYTDRMLPVPPEKPPKRISEDLQKHNSSPIPTDPRVTPSNESHDTTSETNRSCSPARPPPKPPRVRKIVDDQSNSESGSPHTSDRSLSSTSQSQLLPDFPNP